MAKRSNKKGDRPKKRNKLKNFIVDIAIIIAVCYAIVLTINRFFPLQDYDIIKAYSEKNNIPKELVCAIINVESGFNPNVRSNKGASGYMQLMEQTANWGIETLGIEGATYDDIFNPELNIALGTWYLTNLFNQFGSEQLAIISYNAGSGNVTQWLERHSGDIDKTMQNIPYKETKNYYYKVKINETIYRYLLKYYYN